MAAYDISIPTAFPVLRPFEKVGEGDAVASLKRFFVHRAWNVTQQAWETWTTQDQPDPNPPSGDPISGLTVAGTWKQVT